MYTPAPLPVDVSQVTRYLGNELKNIQAEVNGYVTKEYVPTWLGSGGNPVLGNGILKARYRLGPDLCELWLRLVFGSTTAAGAGSWTFGLPVEARDYSQFGEAVILDSGTTWLIGACQANAGAAALAVVTHGSGSIIGAGSPIVWATNDQLHCHIRYLR